MQPDFSVETTLGAGRNCIVFDELRLIAYREVFAFKCDGNLETFQARLERVATGINTQFPNPFEHPRCARLHCPWRDLPGGISAPRTSLSCRGAASISAGRTTSRRR